MMKTNDEWGSFAEGSPSRDKRWLRNEYKRRGEKIIKIRQLPCSESRAIPYLGGFLQFRVWYED